MEAHTKTIADLLQELLDNSEQLHLGRPCESGRLFVVHVAEGGGGGISLIMADPTKSPVCAVSSIDMLVQIPLLVHAATYTAEHIALQVGADEYRRKREKDNPDKGEKP